MKKTILTIAIALATVVVAQAERTTIFERENRFVDRFLEVNNPAGNNNNPVAADGSLRLDPPGGGMDDGNQTGPVGEGLLVLTVLAGGYLVRKRK